MRSTRLAAIAILSLTAVAAIALVPVALRAMPTRYAMRLPEPLQALALPADPTPILPTAVAPVAAAESLLANVPSGATEVPTATPPPSPTPLPIAGAPEAAVASPTPPPIEPTALPTVAVPAAARMTGVSHKFQEWNNCGPATLAMALSFFQLNVSQTDTAAVLKPNPEDRNVSPDEMAAYVNDYTEFNAIARSNGNPTTLKQLISAGVPVVIELGIEPPGEFRWLGWYGHYLLPVAYDDTLGQFWVYDSWFGTSEEPLKNAHPDGRVLTYAQLDTDWLQFNRNYIVLFAEDQRAQVEAILGAELDDDTMRHNNLVQAQADAVAQPENAFAWFNLGTAYSQLGQYENAALAYDKARAIGLPWRMLWYQFGPYQAYLETGRYDDVVLLADVTLTDRPYFEESYYYRGLALNARGDNAAGAEDLAKAAELNPRFSAAPTSGASSPNG